MNMFGLMQRAGGLVALLVLAAFSLSGCGRDSSDPPAAPQQTEVTVGVAGNSQIGALTYDIVLPAGFTLPVDDQGALQPGVLVLNASLPSGGQTTMGYNYMAPTAALPGTLKVSVLFTNGFYADGDGEPVFKLMRPLAAGEVSPAAAALPLALLVESLTAVDISPGFASTISVATVPVP